MLYERSMLATPFPPGNSIPAPCPQHPNLLKLYDKQLGFSVNYQGIMGGGE